MEVPIVTSILRFPNQEKFTLHSVDQTQDISQSDLERIVACCNQPLVYDVLFKEKFAGRPYAVADAQWYINWAKEGWKNQDKFVFFIRDAEEKIVAAIDIKSNDLEAAEAGYWADENTPGIMTNTVIALCTIAQGAGFKSLYGLTVLDNQKSQNVLLRAGFVNEGIINREGKQYLKFVKKFTGSDRRLGD